MKDVGLYFLSAIAFAILVYLVYRHPTYESQTNYSNQDKKFTVRPHLPNESIYFNISLVNSISSTLLLAYIIRTTMFNCTLYQVGIPMQRYRMLPFVRIRESPLIHISNAFYLFTDFQALYLLGIRK